MALAIKSIPTLEGSVASVFLSKAIEKGSKSAATVDFSAQVKSMGNILSKSKSK